MNPRGKSVLFITPGASSVGGNIFILNFLRWFKANTDIPFITIYGHGGDIEDGFRSLGPAYNFGFQLGGLGNLKKVLFKAASELRLRERAAVRAAERSNVGLIYCNAVTNHRILAALEHLDVPVITHCHELESAIYRNGIEGFRYVKRRSHRFVAVAEAVRRNLIESHGVAAGDVDLIHDFVPMPKEGEVDIASARAEVLAEFGLPGNAFIVGASGTMYWRKAPDLFVQIAARVRRIRPEAPIYFFWIGGARKGDFAIFEAEYDARKLGIADRFRVIEHRLDPAKYFAALDVFAMVSREDPFPLVCMEAAAFGKPIICFADAGGMPEFAGEGCGYVVPYLDLDEFAGKIATLHDDPELKTRLGRAAEERARRLHDVEVCAPMMLDLIDRYLSV